MLLVLSESIARCRGVHSPTWGAALVIAERPQNLFPVHEAV